MSGEEEHNMEKHFELLDVVALVSDRSEEGLSRGQVGTIVEILADRVFAVEFSDLEGETYALLTLKAEDLLQLHHRPLEAA
jgi:hypothetical protein